MHRMRDNDRPGRPRRPIPAATLALILAFLGSPIAKADLIRPDAPRAYPDIAADVNGALSYTYDSASQTGQFHVTNSPFMLAGGPLTSDEYNVTPDADGVRQQTLSVTLDPSGKLVAGAGNTYELYGTIVAGNQTFTGLLLKGTPTAFGSQFTPAADASQKPISLFDLDVNITGGALAKAFGPDVYIYYSPELNSTFTGRFDQDFAADKALSNTRAYNAPQPFPSPEPTALALLMVAGVGLAYRRWRTKR